MSEEILRFVDTIHRDRQVDKEVIFTGIEMALVSAAQKRYDQEEGIEVLIDRLSGSISAVRDGESFDPREALGRIAAGTGKQVLFQKIREAEREVIYKEYIDRVGEVFNGTVASRKGGGLVITLGNRAEGFMPRGEQSNLENWNEGDRIKVVLKGSTCNPQGFNYWFPMETKLLSEDCSSRRFLKFLTSSSTSKPSPEKPVTVQK